MFSEQSNSGQLFQTYTHNKEPLWSRLTHPDYRRYSDGQANDPHVVDSSGGVGGGNEEGYLSHYNQQQQQQQQQDRYPSSVSYPGVNSSSHRQPIHRGSTFRDETSSSSEGKLKLIHLG
jgi:hypothetical protein